MTADGRAEQRARDLKNLLAMSPLEVPGEALIDAVCDDVLALTNELSAADEELRTLRGDFERLYERAERVAATLRQALEQAAEPLYDETFRARLLRQGLSTDEIADVVSAIEAMQAHARAALAAAGETETGTA